MNHTMIQCITGVEKIHDMIDKKHTEMDVILIIKLFLIECYNQPKVINTMDIKFIYILNKKMNHQKSTDLIKLQLISIYKSKH